jgi:hypothetical protein
MKNLFKTTCICNTNNGGWSETNIGYPKGGEVIRQRINRTFFNVWWHHSNLLHYFRIFIIFLALILLILNRIREYSFYNYYIVGALILSSEILVKAICKTSVMGCGCHSLGDKLAQFCLTIWLVSGDSDVYLGFVFFITFFTALEIACGLFDFAASAQSVYPSLTFSSYYAKMIFFEITNTKSENKNIRIICRLAYTTLIISKCLNINASYYFGALIPFAIVHVINKCVKLIFLVSSWKETAPSLNQQGIEVMRLQ